MSDYAAFLSTKSRVVEPSGFEPEYELHESLFPHQRDIVSWALRIVGVSDSWESYFQAVRRCWRFGQSRPVNVHLFASKAEVAVVENLQRKEDDARRLAEELSLATRDVVRAAIQRVNRYVPYNPREAVRLPPWLRSAA